MRRLDSTFMFGLLVVVFAWLNPANDWTRVALLIVGVIIVLNAFAPCYGGACQVQPSAGTKAMSVTKKSTKPKAKKKTTKKKATKKTRSKKSRK